MFQTAELGHKVSNAEYREREPALRERLLEVQARLREASFPVIVLFAGVDGAGKGAMTNLLSEWMDPRGIVTRAYGAPSEEERERPVFWRFWRDLPAQGRLGIFLSAWYSEPLVSHVYGNIDLGQFDERLDEIIDFERMLAVDGALIVKFWMHLDKASQKKRFRQLEKDPAESWRVTELDWKNWRKYKEFMTAAERIIMRTSTGRAQWHIVEGQDVRYRSLKVGTILADEIARRLDSDASPQADETAGSSAPSEQISETEASDVGAAQLESRTILDALDMSQSLPKPKYNKALREGQARLNKLHRLARNSQLSTILVFEGWDAGGKGGAIRRVTSALDARAYEVISIAAPTDEERVHHYLWRFWRHIPRAGRVTFFDRSWYGRVLVERVEGFAKEDEWRQAFAEINRFEQQLVEHGIVLMKFWLHITKDEQEKRFRAREEIPYKRWKLTEEDWRNREKWEAYKRAAHDMFERTSTSSAPWVLVPGNDKRFARIKVLSEIANRWDSALKEMREPSESRSERSQVLPTTT